MAILDEPHADVLRILKRAGVTREEVRAVVLAGGDRTDALVRALLTDAVAEDARWAERVKRLEGRIDFAVDALRGGHDAW
jgi:molecular chaperone DnaK (HSP70)